MGSYIRFDQAKKRLLRLLLCGLKEGKKTRASGRVKMIPVLLPVFGVISSRCPEGRDYFPAASASSACCCSSVGSSSKSVMPLATRRLYQEMSFLTSEACTRSRSKSGSTSAR